LSKYSAAVLLLTGVVGSSGCNIEVHGQDIVVREEKRFPVKGTVTVVLDTFDGSIDVRSWDRDEVLVQIERHAADAQRAEALEVQATQDGNRIRVEAREPRRERGVVSIGPFASSSVNLTVSVPRRLTLEARSGDGSIAARDLDGTLALHTGDGSIRAERVGGRVTARTGDGSIDVSDAQGLVDLNSGDGSIHAHGRLGELRVHTGDGSVRVEAEAGSAMETDWTITTGDGSIAVRLPEAFDADVDAHTGDGRVRADWVNDEPRRDEEEQQSFRGKLGKGGRVLRIRSGDGSIEIGTR
jgi:hypothetical protein